MQCPACPVSLVELRVGDLELDECPRCQGMWFDRGEVQGFLSARLATRNVQQRYVPSVSGTAGLAQANCPRCLTSRLRFRSEGSLSVDDCARCGGTWISAPVISAILAAAEEAPEEPPEGPLEETPEGAAGAPHQHLAEAHPRAKAAPAPGRHAPSGGPEETKTSPSRAQRSEARARPKPAPASANALLAGCTACNGPMDLVTHEGQEFHRCTGCEALFFPRGGLPFFLSQHARAWTPPTRPAPDPGEEPRCPGCTYAMRPMTLSSHPVRVWACSQCWSMFASANGVRRLCRPEEHANEELSQPAMALWRMLDAFTEWLVNPPKSDRSRYR